MNEPKLPLLIATADGLIVSDMDGQSFRRTLDGVFVSSVIAREGVILAGTEDGVWRSDDLGASWFDSSRGLTDRRIRWLAFHPHVSDFELAGTASAAIFISRDGAESWRPIAETSVDWAAPLEAAGTVQGLTTMNP